MADTTLDQLSNWLRTEPTARGTDPRNMAWADHDDALIFVDDRNYTGPRGTDRKATAKRRAANRAARKARKARP